MYLCSLFVKNSVYSLCHGLYDVSVYIAMIYRYTDTIMQFNYFRYFRKSVVLYQYFYML